MGLRIFDDHWDHFLEIAVDGSANLKERNYLIEDVGFVWKVIEICLECFEHNGYQLAFEFSLFESLKNY